MAVIFSGSELSVPDTTHLSNAFTKKEMKHKHVALPPKPYLPCRMGCWIACLILVLEWDKASYHLAYEDADAPEICFVSMS